MFRFLQLVAIGLACSTGMAPAQEAVPPQPLDPARLLKLLPKRGAVTGASQTVLGAGGATLNSVGNVPLGWNYFHATNCQWITDGVNNVLYVFPAEGGFWFYVNNFYATKTFLTLCVNGNLGTVNVINRSSGDFNSIWTSTSK